MFSSSLPGIVEVLQEFFNTLPEGCASLSIEPQPDGENYVKLIPKNSSSAVIAARGGGRLRYELLVGQGTTFEVMPQGRGLTDVHAAEEVHAICAAVCYGGFEEVIWTASDRLAKSIGRLSVCGRSVTVRIRHSYFPFRRTTKTVVKYPPYCETGHHVSA